jgi:iron complex transport system ATP-binding protein
LREGRVVAQGLIGETITGDNLSATFGVPLKVVFDDGRFTARSV